MKYEKEDTRIHFEIIVPTNTDAVFTLFGHERALKASENAFCVET